MEPLSGDCGASWTRSRLGDDPLAKGVSYGLRMHSYRSRETGGADQPPFRSTFSDGSGSACDRGRARSVRDKRAEGVTDSDF